MLYQVINLLVHNRKTSSEMVGFFLLCTVSAQQQCQILLEFADDLQLGLAPHFTGIKNILK